MRKAMMAIAVGMLMAVTVSGMTRAGTQEAAVDSGALGLSRAGIETQFGQAETPIAVPGHPIYDETYGYETEEGTLFVSYREINGEEFASYVEFSWRGDGASEQVARTTVESLIPSDAELTEIYVAPPTSSGPIALVTERYESESLGANPGLAPELLVIYQEQWSDSSAADNTLVMAVSITIRERTQVTP